jgi:putative copper resistance protein D
LTLHLLCAAFWLGALVPLLTVAHDGDLEQLARTAARFGQMALAVVAALLVAGLCLLWTLIGDAATFWSGDYGRLMAAKLCTVALLLCLAALNKLSLTPRLLRGDGRAMTIFRRSATSEMVLGGVILLITATFTTLTGPARIP